MKTIAFYEVAPYERSTIEAARFEGAESRTFVEALDESTLEMATNAEVVSVFIYSRITAAVLAKLPKLKLIVTRSSGFDHVDLEACRRLGVAVANVPSYGENTVAEHAFALLLGLAKKLAVALRKTRSMDFSLEGLLGIDLQGKTLGVIGAGRIGVNAMRIGRGFGMHAIAYDPREAPELAEREGFHYVPFDALLRESDVVSVHAALTPQTHHMFDREAFRKMRRGAILINTARGAIVDSEALCEALHEGWIAGAGLDAFEGEELLKDEAQLLHKPLSERQIRQLTFCYTLLRHETVIMTPHSAFLTRESVDRLVSTSLAVIRAFLTGRPQLLVAEGKSSLR